MKTLQPDQCKDLDWDSTFFGRRIVRLESTTLHPAALRSSLEWCRKEHVDCAYLLADPKDAQTILLAEQAGFHLVDVRVSLVWAVDAETPVGNAPTAGVRLYRSGDLDALKAIAKTSHRDSRFYFDAHFPVERCDQLYETWIEKSCLGWADCVMVAEVDGVPCGYCTCHLQHDGKSGSIGLVGVSPAVQRQGWGKRLIESAIAYFRNNQVFHVSVVTQARNTSAQRTYQRCGFLTDSVALWYHKWFTTEVYEDR